MGTIRYLFVQTGTFVLFLACVTVKNRLPVPLPLERGVLGYRSRCVQKPVAVWVCGYPVGLWISGQGGGQCGMCKLRAHLERIVRPSFEPIAAESNW
jgi:hypothetical protein